MKEIRYMKANIAKDDLSLTAICEVRKKNLLTMTTYEYEVEDMVTGIKLLIRDNFEEITVYEALKILKNITGSKLKDYGYKIKAIQSEYQKEEKQPKPKHLF